MIKSVLFLAKICAAILSPVQIRLIQSQPGSQWRLPRVKEPSTQMFFRDPKVVLLRTLPGSFIFESGPPSHPVCLLSDPDKVSWQVSRKHGNMNIHLLASGTMEGGNVQH